MRRHVPTRREFWDQFVNEHPLQKTRDGLEVLFFIFSIIGIFAAGDAFLIHRRSQLDVGIVTTQATNRDTVEGAVRSRGLSTDVIPPTPSVSLNGKSVYPNSFSSWLKLAANQGDGDGIKAAFDKAFGTSDLAEVPAEIRSDSWLASLYLRTKKGSDQRTAQGLVEQVVKEAMPYTVIIDVSNKGDGDSGQVSVDIPSKVTVDNHETRWTIAGDHASLDRLRPSEVARLVLSSDHRFDFNQSAAHLNNSSGVVAQNLGLFVVIAVLFSLSVFLLDLAVAAKRKSAAPGVL